MSNQHPALSAMSAIAEAMIKHYKTDFTKHDSALLAETPASVPFVWEPYESGTQLFTLESVRNGVSCGWTHYYDCVRSSARRSSTPPQWYHWNGYRLSKIDLDGAYELVRKWEREATPETEEHRNARLARGGW